MAVEEFDGVAEAVADDRAAVAIGVFFQIPLDAAEDVVEILVVSEVRFAEHRLEVRGEAFVEPCVRPIAAREQIAEPLMRQLVRNERIAREIQVRAFVVQRAFGLRGRRGVFHAAEDEVRHGDLRVARERILRAETLFEDSDHLRRLAESALAVGLAPGKNVIRDRNAVHRLSARPPRTGRQPASSDRSSAARPARSERSCGRHPRRRSTSAPFESANCPCGTTIVADVVCFSCG